ncbi:MULTISPECIES: hypothetical protein [unclassified Pseudomonas]|uniref:hypothetical protein n=1 Tax=unclassified Pseudomonas TaxID=196821 RepID=UPI002249182D|nr:hypothetical protein [Pseudomonas sp. DCB_BG]MCX2708340.1 hypothetical protein [Pseudomonas sp. DCB_BG]
MSTGEILPGITLPPVIHGLLRKRLTEIQVSDTAVNCLISQARAASLAEALEVLHAIPKDAVERLYVMIEHEASQRLDAIAKEL